MRYSKVRTFVLAFGLIALFPACQPDGSHRNMNSEFPITTESEPARVEFYTGLYFYDLGNNQKAREKFSGALAMDPGFALAYVYRSWTSGSTEEFSSDVKNAVVNEEGVSKAEQLIIDIDRTYLRDDLEKRVKLAEKLVRELPDVARAQDLLGGVYLEAGDMEAARSGFGKAIELAPEWVGGYMSMGNSFLFNEPKDSYKAEQNFMKVVLLAPNSSRAAISLGDAYRAQGDLEKALTAYEKAAELDPTDPRAYGKAGHVNSFLGNYKDARENYRLNRQYNDYKTSSLNFEAYTYLYAGNHIKALEWLEYQVNNLDSIGVEESRRNSTQMGSLNSCAWIALHHGEIGHMEKIVNQMRPISEAMGQASGTDEALLSAEAHMLFWEGVLATMEGDFDAAHEKAAQSKTTLLEINNPRKLEDYHFLMGYLEQEEGNPVVAITHLQQSDINNIYMRYTLAMAYKQAGDQAKADEILSQIVNYNFNSVGYALIRDEVRQQLNL